jgi:tetratricopeptide (TPR) repeat protein
MPKAIKKKAAKKARPEEIQDVYAGLQEKFRRRRRTVLAVVIAAFSLLAAAGGAYFYRENRLQTASEMNYRGYKLFHDLYTKEPLTKEDRMNRAIESFRKAYKAKKSPYSLFYIGSAYYELGDYGESVKAFDEIERSFPEDDIYLPLSHYRTAMAYLAQGRKEDALRHLEMLSSLKTGALKDVALFEGARLLESEGRKDEARKWFDRLKKETPESAYAKETLEREKGSREKGMTNAPSAAKGK